jgi:hypothetical protein
MKRGGQVIYAGPVGHHSYKLIEYFEVRKPIPGQILLPSYLSATLLDLKGKNIFIAQAIPGVPKIRDGYNPATWMLEISSPAAETHLGVDFAEVYSNSPLFQ